MSTFKKQSVVFGRSVLAGAVLAVLVALPACTLSQVDQWRSASGLGPVPASEASEAVEVASAWWVHAQADPELVRLVAAEAASSHGVSGDEWLALATIIHRETGGTWNPTAQNPRSSAYGLGQFLDSTWRQVGIAKTSDPAVQVRAMIRYCRDRYGSARKALEFHRANGWY